MATRIPIPERAPLMWLAQLPPSTYEELASALKASKVARHPGRLAAQLQPRLKGFEPDKVYALLGVLTSRAPLLGLDASDASGEISDSEDLHLEAPDRKVLRERLASLFSIDSIRITAKAADVAYDQPRNLQSARILTDLRPVFSEPVGPSIKAAAIVHTLKLTFSEGYDQEDLFVALDSDDVKALRDLLDRAEAKARSLTVALKPTGIEILDGGEDNS